MGRPYDTELARLSATYDWALNLDICKLKRAILTARALPLVAIGSGGSLTTAHFIADLHKRYAGQIASVATPLEVMNEQLNRHMSAWVLSAGGRNVDINSSFCELVQREPSQLGVICGQPESPLVEKAMQHKYVDLCTFSLPEGKDGFLATNSLLAFCVFIARAYVEECDEKLKAVHPEVVPNAEQVGLDTAVLAKWQGAVESLWTRETTIVLHGAASRTGAIDLESKFTEAALGNIQIADYRNFAHGRHHWLAKHGETSAILAFVSSGERALASKTLALIPDKVPIARIDLAGDHLTVSLASLVAALHITGWAGIARGIDPGRPGVPIFGRRIYNLSIPRIKKRVVGKSPEDAIVIERKAGVSVNQLHARGDLSQWLVALEAFKKSLTLATYSAVIFDYDGTLIDTRSRYDLPSAEVVSELIRLIEMGLIIGIATGRGSSIRHDLQKCMPKSTWKRIIIGYYNGSEVASLEDDTCPHGTPEIREDLVEIAKILDDHSEMKTIAIRRDHYTQITLRPRLFVPEDRLWDVANQFIQLQQHNRITVVRSSHSIDILASGVSKRSVIAYINRKFMNGNEAVILKIGDRGRWPGNDFELLSDPYTLSVDELSADPETCWNLAPQGQRGVQVTLGYCRSLHELSDGVHYMLNSRKKRP